MLLDDPYLGKHHPVGSAPSMGSQQLPDLSASLDFEGSASLYVEAKSVSLTLAEATSTLRMKPGSCLPPFVGSELNKARAGRFNELCPDSPMLLSAQPEGLSNVTVHVEGVTVLEWHNAAISCSHDPCPSGGVRDEQGGQLASAEWQQRSLSFVRATADGGTLDFEGTTGLVLAGASALGLHVAGMARFPEAQGSACASCLEPDGRTFRATGEFTLANVHPEGDWMVADMDGDFTSVRFDEQAVDPAQLAKAVGVGVAVVGSVALLAKALASLFTRLLPERALDHSARQKVFRAVCAAPGSTYRALMAATGLSDGGVRNHLKRLEQAGHIVSRRHGRVVVYFENHGRYDATWRSGMVLRDPVLRRLLGWIAQNPQGGQAAVLAFAQQELGLGRTPAQRRLGRLEAWGLVKVRRQRGKASTYEARA